MLWTLLCLFCMSALAPQAAGSAASPSLFLRLSGQPASAPIPLDFLGFSGAEATLSVLSWRPAAGAAFEPRPSFTALMRLLGGSIRLRFGHFYSANSSAARHLSPSAILVNASSCSRLSAALASFRGSLTGMLAPVDLSDGAFVAATGPALAACLGRQLLSLELANEPDISSFRGNFSGYVAALALWTAALEAAGVRQLVDAPVLAGSAWWPSMPAFLSQFSLSLRSFVQHRYGLSACRGAVNSPEALMRVSTNWSSANDSLLLGRVASAGLPFLVGEANTVSCNGSVGVSDVFASALYAIDASLSAAAANISGFTWHGLGDGSDFFSYQPIFYDLAGLAEPGLDQAQPRPLFLGLWLLAEAGVPGGTLLRLEAQAAGSDLLRAWALRPSAGGSTRVVLLHKDAAAGPASVTVAPAGAGCSAGQEAQAALLLAGPGGLSARQGSSFGNQSFDGTGDGLPVGQRTLLPVPCDAASGTFRLQLAAGSGAVLHLPQ
jgi:hypothetical protein